METRISKSEFFTRFKPTGNKRSAIFSNKKDLMEEIYATGASIYCDQSYYAQSSHLDLVIKNFNDDTKNIIELRTLLNNSDIPFLIDINEFDKLPSYFQEEIKKEYIKIFN